MATISESNIIVRYESNLDELKSSANATAIAVQKLEDSLDGSVGAAEAAAKSINGLRALQNKYTADLSKLEIGSEEYLKTQKELIAVNQKLNKEMGILDGTVQRQQKSIGGLRGILGGVATAFAGIQLGSFVAEIAGLGIKAEQTRISFETFLGSAEKAEKVIKQLSDFAAITPFETDQVVQAGKALLAFGTPARALVPTLKAIGDISAGTGKDFNELAVIFGKARTQGTLFGEDINQLTEAGIPIIQEFAKQLGVSEGEVKKLASEGKISFSNLEKAFQSLTSEGGKFFDLTAKQSQTVGGLLSTLRSNVVEVGKSIGTALLPVLRAILNAAISVVAGLSDIGGVLSRNINIIIAVATALLTFNAATIQAALNTARLAIATQIQTVSFAAQVAAMKAAQAIGTAYSAVVGVLTGRITLATVAQRAWNLIMSANPIGLLITAVGALTSALIYYNRNNAEAIALDEAKTELNGKLEKAITDVTSAQDRINESIDRYNELSPEQQKNLIALIELEKERTGLALKSLKEEQEAVRIQASRATDLQRIKNAFIGALNPFPDVTIESLNITDAINNGIEAADEFNPKLKELESSLGVLDDSVKEIDTAREKARQERLRKQKEANEAGRKDREKALEQQRKDEAEAAKKISDLRIEAIDDESERKIERIQEDARIEIAAAKGTAEQIEIQRQLIAKAAIKEIDKIRAEAESAKAIEVKIQTVEEKRFNVKSSERDGLITEDEARIEEQKLTLETLRIQLENAGDDRIKIMQQVVEAEIALEQLIVDEKKKKLQQAIDDRIKLLEEERLAVKEQLRDGLIDAEDAALKEQEINIKSLKVQLDAAEVGSIDYIKIKQQIADAETAIEKDTTAKVKAEQEERRKAVVEAAQSVISIAKQIADARIAQLDREIAAQQGRVDSALQTIEQGNTEQVQMEEDRLARLNEARQEAVEKQRIINAIEIAANNALAISQGIVAVTSAFAKGSFVEGIATSIALAATLAGTVLSVRNALSGVGSFAKGTERLTMKDGKPTTGTGMLIEAHAGERILTAKQNKEIGGLSNEKAVELIKKGKQFELATPYQNMRAIASNNQQQSTALVAVAGAKANEVKQMQLEIGGLQKTMQSVDNSLSVIGKQIKNMKNEVHITEDGIYSIHQKHESRIAEKKHALR